jgi:chromate reductase
MANYRFLVISGSLRKDSLNTKLAHAFIAQAPEGVTMELGDISSIPLYNGDIDAAGFPAEVTALKDQIRGADGIVLITPEYNRSMPGVLKNVLDYTSRPYGESAWTGKPVFVAGATGGPIGTALAQYDAKKVLMFVGAHPIPQPEFYMGGATDKFDAEGKLVDEATKGYIDKAIATLVTLAGKLR